MTNFNYAGTSYNTRREMLAAQVHGYVCGEDLERESHLEYIRYTAAKTIQSDMKNDGWRFDGDFAELEVAREDVRIALFLEVRGKHPHNRK